MLHITWFYYFSPYKKEFLFIFGLFPIFNGFSTPPHKMVGFFFCVREYVFDLALFILQNMKMKMDLVQL